MNDQMMRRSDDQMIDKARGPSNAASAACPLRQRIHSLIISSSDHLISSILLAFVLLPLGASAQRSPFNGLEVLPADSTGHYRILIGGHFHGESTNRSGYPAATLLANLDTINSLSANLFLSTGDLFMDAAKDSARYQQALFSRLKVPLYNAIGNHDPHTNGNRLWDLDEPIPFGIGEPWFLKSELGPVLILDTEKQDGSIVDVEWGALERLSDPQVLSCKRLFIISHRPIWSEDDPQYSPLFKDNTRSLTGTNFQKDVYPLLEKIAEHAHVYWISGSLGGQAPSSIFFQEHAKNITYIQCAIRDEPRDALLIADVYPDTVKWSSFSLTGQKLLAPEAYNAAWWQEHVGKSEGFNWRLLPYLVKTTVLRKEFWWGVLGGVLVLMLIRRFLRR